MLVLIVKTINLMVVAVDFIPLSEPNEAKLIKCYNKNGPKQPYPIYLR